MRYFPHFTVTFLKPAKFFLGISAAAMLTSLVLLITPGPKLSIDFTGGTLMEITVPAGTDTASITQSVQNFETEPAIDYVTVARTDAGTAIIRLRDLSNDEHTALIAHLSSVLGDIDEQQFTTIGPTVGETLKERAIWALIIASLAIVLYVAFAFRSVPRKLSPWRFGVIAVITLIHDVLITFGIFVLISQHTAFEMDTLFITALLTILGYSVNDTIVIFDRIRENVSTTGKHEEFSAVAERSLRESFTRSFNTSFSTLIMLFALYFLGSESIQWFVLTLIVGMIIGSYSSIFIATPLLVYWRKRKV